jgi:hypothetical protein
MIYNFKVKMSEKLGSWLADTAISNSTTKASIIQQAIGILKVHQDNPGSHICLSKDGKTVDKIFTNVITQKEVTSIVLTIHKHKSGKWCIRKPDGTFCCTKAGLIFLFNTEDDASNYAQNCFQ